MAAERVCCVCGFPCKKQYDGVWKHSWCTGEASRLEAKSAPTTATMGSEVPPEKQSLWSLLKKMIGCDLTSIALPIALHEPTTFLQKLLENLEHHRLLAEAAQCSDSVEQMALTAAFAAAAYSSNRRLTKPFNPHLGETYAYEDESLRFLAEQVSHHPPVAACVLHGRGFVFWQDVCVKTHFRGNSLDVELDTQWHVLFTANGNHITWGGLRTVIHAIFIGHLWLDCFGKQTLTSLTHGETARLKVKPSRDAEAGRGRTTCTVYDHDGQPSPRWSFTGRLTDCFLTADGRSLWSIGASAQPVPGDPYKRSAFVMRITAQSPDQRLPPTDSRHRADLQALQAGDTDRAAAEKHRLEQQQRQQHNQHQPRWFVQACPPHCPATNTMWLYKGHYWDQYSSAHSWGPDRSLIEQCSC